MERRKGDMVGRGKVDGEIAVSRVEEKEEDERKASAAAESSSISDGEKGCVQRSGLSV
jgi:hypothetical protein